MSLETKVKKGLLMGGIALANIFFNPNYESQDFSQPHRFIQKFDYQRGYPSSGKVYTASAAALAASLIGIGYAAATTKK